MLQVQTHLQFFNLSLGSLFCLSDGTSPVTLRTNTHTQCCYCCFNQPGFPPYTDVRANSRMRCRTGRPCRAGNRRLCRMSQGWNWKSNNQNTLMKASIYYCAPRVKEGPWLIIILINKKNYNISFIMFLNLQLPVHFIQTQIQEVTWDFFIFLNVRKSFLLVGWCLQQRQKYLPHKTWILYTFWGNPVITLTALEFLKWIFCCFNHYNVNIHTFKRRHLNRTYIQT